MSDDDRDRWRPSDALRALLLLAVFTSWFYFIGWAVRS
jgi:hypothetical protein